MNTICLNSFVNKALYGFLFSLNQCLIIILKQWLLLLTPDYTLQDLSEKEEREGEIAIDVYGLHLVC